MIESWLNVVKIDPMTEALRFSFFLSRCVVEGFAFVPSYLQKSFIMIRGVPKKFVLVCVAAVEEL